MKRVTVPSIPDSVVSVARTVGRWLLGRRGSNGFTGYRWPTTAESSNSKAGSAESAEDPQSLGDHWLSITVTKMDNKVPCVVFSASFATNGSLVPEMLRYLSQLQTTSPTRQRYMRWGEK